MLRVGLWAPEAGQPCSHVLSGFGAFHVVRTHNLAQEKDPLAARLVTLLSVCGARAPAVHTASTGLRCEPPSLPQSRHFLPVLAAAVWGQLQCRVCPLPMHVSAGCGASPQSSPWLFLPTPNRCPAEPGMVVDAGQMSAGLEGLY